MMLRIQGKTLVHKTLRPWLKMNT
uniref:Uncharacterized protein n=1 Tax=Lepeophtheirus salmonis TaxID=72036 RepID=A0A0K2TP26_LEPSM